MVEHGAVMVRSSFGNAFMGKPCPLTVCAGGEWVSGGWWRGEGFRCHDLIPMNINMTDLFTLEMLD